MQVVVTKHARERWNLRIHKASGKPFTDGEIADILRSRLMSRSLRMQSAGEGFALWCRGMKVVVSPIESGWKVLTVFPIGHSELTLENHGGGYRR